ncbi:MAG: GH3 auxin-responsive promoter family protein [Bacteroidetes bacterium]|nr:GH3 auxin-responsive promoter family protein [Bacteroidota bacterium]
MQIINNIVSSVIKTRISRIRNYMENPDETQYILFKNLLHSARNTIWGKDHDYANISSIKEFKEKVSIQDYDSLKPFINRLLKGEHNVLWPSKIKWFAKSSGTTSDKSKFLPVSKEAIKDCHYEGTKDLLASYCNEFPKSNLFDGKSLIIGGSHVINEMDHNTHYGDLSAVLLQNMSLFAKALRTPSLPIALMDDFEKKIELMAEESSRENVVSISGVPTWTIVLIKYLLKMTGQKDLKKIWPNLELYMHGGVSFAPYVEQFKGFIIDSNMHYRETYNASEGNFAAQLEENADDLVLLLENGIFYEFMPVSEYEKEHPITLQLDEVKINENYILVISTNAGLWRYVIGDTIKFTSTYPFKIKVTGRIKHFINAFGEEVVVENAEHAITEACKFTGAVVSEFTAAPVYFSDKENGRHEWLIEFDKEPNDLIEFGDVLDKSLQSVNSDYEAKRFKDIALKEPLIRVLENGTFHKWLDSKDQLGGQHKVPRLSNDRKYLEEILEFV